MSLHKETFAATKEIRHDGGFHLTRFPMVAAAVLLVVYVAMYLTVAGVVHVLVSPHAAAAVAPECSTAPSVPATAPSPPVGAGESATMDSLGQTSEWAANSRECAPVMPSPTID